MSTRLHIVVSDDLLARIDAARGEGQPRADFIRRAVSVQCEPYPTAPRRAVEQALGEPPGGKGRGDAERAESALPRASAEQPADVDAILGKAAEGLEFNRGPRVRSSAAARPFRPAPKKGEK